MSEVLVVAGEASGDRIAALVARALAAEGVRCVGVGGPACRTAGVETLVDTAQIAAMGIGDVIARAGALGAAISRIAAHVRRGPPRAALLVNFTELNQRLGRWLRARGTRVLWCVAPQVWAWRPDRVAALRDAADRMAVILPFEERLWRDAGYDAVYVGHPAVDDAPRPARDALGLAILPGSRAGEVARLLAPFVAAGAALLSAGRVTSARVVIAPGLPVEIRGRILRRARDAHLAVVEGGGSDALSGAAVSLCASGTASLEAALSGAAPVVAYRMDPLSFALARRLVRTPHVALPNVLLGRRAFPELLQADVTPSRIRSEAQAILDRRDEALALAASLREILTPPSPAPFGTRVARLLLPWLA